MEVGLLLCEAQGDLDCEYMRLIRNECRTFMTRDTKRIPPWKQRLWWRKLDRKVNQPYLLKKDGVPVGYGLIRQEKEKKWISGGLITSHRGRGWGKFLFHCLANLAGNPCYLEVMANNLPALRVYTSLGFMEESRKDGILTMRRALS